MFHSFRQQRYRLIHETRERPRESRKEGVSAVFRNQEAIKVNSSRDDKESFHLWAR